MSTFDVSAHVPTIDVYTMLNRLLMSDGDLLIYDLKHRPAIIIASQPTASLAHERLVTPQIHNGELHVYNIFYSHFRLPEGYSNTEVDLQIMVPNILSSIKRYHEDVMFIKGDWGSRPIVFNDYPFLDERDIFFESFILEKGTIQ